MRLDPAIEARNLAGIIARRYPEPDPAALAEAVDVWHRVTDWTSIESKTAGLLGDVVLHRLTARSGSTPELERIDMPAEVAAYGRRPVDGEAGVKVRMLDPRWVNPDRVPVLGAELVGLDVNGQYLGAAGDQLGTGLPEPITAGTDAAAVMKLPGYGVLADDLVVPDGHPATVLGILRDLRAGDVLAMPTVRYLADDLGLPVELAGGHVWTKSRRWLGDWQRLFRDAREALIGMGPDDLAAAYALAAVKAVTNGFLGGWLRAAEHNHNASLRADWAHQVIARARMNALRSITKAGADPFGIVADTVYLGAGEVGGMRLDEVTFGLGSWKTEKRAVVTAEIVAAHAAGRPNRLRDAINTAHEEARR